MSEPIAIIGMSCRFPGAADSIDGYWTLLRTGVDAIGEVPADRWDLASLYHPDPGTPGKMYSRFGGFLGGIDAFDAAFFGIAPREAEQMDPQQRLLLEVAAEALESAGQPLDRLEGSRTGVFVGIGTNDYAALRGGSLETVDAYTGTGNALSVAAGRLSYVFGLHGPTLAVDTACSASLVAVHLACQSLRTSECDAALVGGVNLILAPDVTVYLCQLRALAPDGRCKTFDAGADGYVRGEGCAVLVLKRLSDAQRDADPILAVIRGSAINHDGRSNGLTAPNGAAQQAVLRAALSDAGVQPADVAFVEAHGTGTPLGDGVELAALSSVFGAGRPPHRHLLVGSVKTNVGHLEAAAGIAGLIKAVLAIRHGEIPPHLHFKTPNPHLEWTPAIDVNGEGVAWPSAYTERIAGVSSFGISGTNAHVILAQAPASAPAAASHAAPILLPLSARHPDALRALVQAVRAQPLHSASVGDVAYTAAVRRSHHEHRLSVLAHTPEELDARLGAFLQGEPAPDLWTGSGVSSGRRKVAFVFAGQGGQWPGMGRQLLATEPAFRAVIEQCDQAMREFGDWSLLQQLSAEEWDGIEIIQPAVFAVQVALAALWREWGIEPDAVVGHSMGEVAAAHVAGILSLADAARVVCRRSALLRRLSGRGAMALVELPLEAAQARLGAVRGVSVAVSNSARATVLSGDVAALDALITELETEGVYCRRVKVDVASHSPQVDALAPDLLQALAGLEPRPARCPLYSTVTGSLVEGPEIDAAYWMRNLRQPVLFADTVGSMTRDGHTVFIEVGPHPILRPSIEDNVAGLVEDPLVLASMRRDEPERETMLRALGAVFAAGHSPAWHRVYPGGSFVSLPRYPWRRERFWIAPAVSRQSRQTGQGHPLLGPHVEPVEHPGSHVWETTLALDALPYFADHRLGQQPVFPAAGYAELALAAAAGAFGDDAPYSVEDLSFHKLLVLDASSPCTLQVCLSDASAPHPQVRIATRMQEQESWTTHATARLRRDPERSDPAAAPTWGDATARCRERIDGVDYYQALAAQGLPYGESFRGITEIWRGADEAIARLTPAGSIGASGYLVHPVLLDLAFQTMGAALRPGGDAPYLPAAVGHLRLWRRPGRELTVHARITGGTADGVGAVEGDLWLADKDGLVLEARQVRVEPLGAGNRLSSWLHRVAWVQCARAADEALRPTGPWLILGPVDAGGERLARRLEQRGARVDVRPCGLTDAPALLDALTAQTGEPYKGVVWMPGGSDGDDVAAAAIENGLTLLAVLQSLVRTGWRDMPRLVIVTVGCQPAGDTTAPPSITHAPLWGVGRTIAMEHPEFACTCLDVSAGLPDDELDGLCDELCAAPSDQQIALRGSQRWAARLTRDDGTGEGQSFPPARGQAYRLEIDRPGVLDSLTLRATRRRPPRPGEVELRVTAAGLNFLDVLGAMGVRPDLTTGPVQLGGECAGIVEAIGDDVAGLAVGDEVMAVAPHAFGTHVTTRADFVVRRPESLPPVDAAGVPVAFLTAYYALHHIGRLRRGERVLIHSAAGGVGQAAVQVARWLGAEIFATAGSPEKRGFLSGQGVPHVMDSRTLEFAEQIKTRTGGCGVDVVLNSLTGPAVTASLDALAPYGRFLEIGKKDVYGHERLDLWPFHRNLSYSMIDLARMLRERPELCAALLREIGDLFRAGTLTALPRQVVAMAQASEAFRDMAQARHIGKIVLSLENTADARIAGASGATADIRSDATYLLTGGFGGLGLAVARWMVAEGARHLVLLGRRGPSAAAARAVEEMREAGAAVHVRAADVADRTAVEEVVKSITREMPPLAGVVHAAGVLEDSTLLQLDAARFRRVLAPKVSGGWNLHLATRDLPLDFFVLFSSGSALLGSPGQGNYNAANAFLDALAHYRRARGWPALSIDWGPFADVGMVAGAEWTERLASRGMGSLTAAQGTSVLRGLLGHASPQVAVLPLNVRQWRQVFPRLGQMPFFSELLAGGPQPGGPGGDSLRQQLMAADPKQRAVLLEHYLRQQLALVLRLPPDRIGARVPFQTLGLDSLMALELRNRLEEIVRAPLPATLVWQYPTLAVLAEHLGTLTESVVAAVAGTPAEAAPEPLQPVTSALDRVAELSDEEVDRLLAEKLGGASDPLLDAAWRAITPRADV